MKFLLTVLLTVSVIPLPNSVVERNGSFQLDEKTAVVSTCAEFEQTADDFCEDISLPTGYDLPRSRHLFGKAVLLKMDRSIVPEGYTLDVRSRKVVIKASDAAGAFYGLQTLRQLMPAEIYGKVKSETPWKAQCCTIKDAPGVGYRGMLLDCCRYFYPKEAVLKFIDMMAMHKMNNLQWHLTEDQGWRIEIKKYPLLTEVGAWRDESPARGADVMTLGEKRSGDGVRHGGFYTQDDIREIVEYASRRHVNIVPEIELPGHSSAAIAAYPWLSCNPCEPKKVSTRWGVMEDVYCPTPETFKFLEDVFDEIVELFPSPYYHIGGDECPKTAWRNSEYCRNLAEELGLESVDDLQYYFVKHFDQYLRDKGKTVIGWDEILDGSAVPTTVVMSYRGFIPGMKAMKKDMKVIFCANRWFYYDYHQNEIEDIPRNQHLFITLRKAYSTNPRALMGDSLMNAKGHLIMGYQACVWGEMIPDASRLEHQTFPREAAVAELCWSDESVRDWEDFKFRMVKELARLDARGVNYSKAFYNVIVNMDLESDYPREVELELDYPYATIHYTADGTDPDAGSPVPAKTITVNRGDTIKAQGFTEDGEPVGVMMVRTFGI